MLAFNCLRLGSNELCAGLMLQRKSLSSYFFLFISLSCHATEKIFIFLFFSYRQISRIQILFLCVNLSIRTASMFKRITRSANLKILSVKVSLMMKVDIECPR
jgi:hypothetical protein